MDVHQIDWNALPWTRVRERVERKAFSGSGATLALHRLMPGNAPDPHSHAHEQIVYVLSGRIRFGLGSETVDVGTGGLLVVPSNVMHWAEVMGNGPALVLDVFTPKRAEYAS